MLQRIVLAGIIAVDVRVDGSDSSPLKCGLGTGLVIAAFSHFFAVMVNNAGNLTLTTPTTDAAVNDKRLVLAGNQALGKSLGEGPLVHFVVAGQLWVVKVGADRLNSSISSAITFAGCFMFPPFVKIGGINGAVAAVVMHKHLLVGLCSYQDVMDML